jgi:hypothetical protein
MGDLTPPSSKSARLTAHGAANRANLGAVRRVLVVLPVLILAGCGVDAPATPATTTTRPLSSTTSAPSTTTTTTTAPASTTTTTAPWVLGARPLPIGADGNPEVLPTPPQLVDRQLATVDVLPPPADGGFHSTIASIDAATRARMGSTWHDGCPVALADLRHVTLSFVGFDGKAHTGELIVAASVADDVVSVFHQLFDARFPIEEMRIVSDADLTAPATGDGNDTAAFVCRDVRGGTHWSSHARGLAIDLDPFQNPYSSGARVLPELASAYLDRSDVRPGMIEPGDAVTQAFASVGWTWGGSWHSPVDRMHFSADGH